MTVDRRLMEQALESLQTILGYRQTFLDIHQVMEDLKTRLAQPEQEPVATLFGSLPVYDVPTKQEPVAWMHNFIDEVAITHRPVDLDRYPDRWTPLYKDPTSCQTCEALARSVMMDQTYHDSVMAQREWVGLTDEEIDAAVKSCSTTDTYKYFRAIEAKLREKNGL